MIGQCSGTWGATPGEEGAGRHTQQTVPESYAKRTRVGANQKGEKGHFSVSAAKNRVAPLLVQEIMQAARLMWQDPEPGSKRPRSAKRSGSELGARGEN